MDSLYYWYLATAVLIHECLECCHICIYKQFYLIHSFQCVSIPSNGVDSLHRADEIPSLAPFCLLQKQLPCGRKCHWLESLESVLWFYHFWLEVDLENSVPLSIKQENWITQFWYSYNNPCFGYWNRKAVPQNEESCGSGQKLMISKEVLPAKRWMLSTKFSPLTN